MTAADLRQVPFKPIDFLPREIDVDRRDDGTLVVRHRRLLMAYERHVTAFIAKWAAEAPDRVFLAQRRGADRQWLKLSYAEAKRQIDAVTQALLDRGAGPDKPVMILSGNSLEHAVLTFAAMQARAPATPVSPAYALLSKDYVKLKHVFELVRPGLILVQDGPPFAAALDALDLTGVTVVHVDRPVPGRQSVAWDQLVATAPTDAVRRSVDAITPDTVGKFLFTSGSTGMPKAVINTQRMMCANIAMGQQVRPDRGKDEPGVGLAWLPWAHTMGGNAGLHGALADGATLYLDDGRPLPGQFDETIRNLREIAVTSFSNVPAGYAALAVALERDEALATMFFSKLNILAYGGATLPDDLYERIERLAVKHTGYRIPFITGWGSTETAPTATLTYWASERVGLVGLPFPGVELKMVPVGPPDSRGQRYEMRLKGPLVMPGYHKRPDLTAAAFDEDGFYRIGDAGRLVDPGDVAQGIEFDGRVVEDFKLMSGTFVHVGSLRIAAVGAASPVLQDAVVAGQDKEYVALLGFPNVMACRQLAGDPEGKLSIPELLRHPAIVTRARDGLRAMNKAATGSSLRARRLLLMAEPPSIDGHEITDKGYVNQRAALERRAALVDALYAEPPGEGVIVVG